MKKIKAFSSPKGKLISFRSKKTSGFDFLKIKKKFTFLQIGKNPVKFIIYVPRETDPPMWIYSFGWQIKYRGKRLIIGETVKPLQINKIMRLFENVQTI